MKIFENVKKPTKKQVITAMTTGMLFASMALCAPKDEITAINTIGIIAYRGFQLGGAFSAAVNATKMWSAMTAEGGQDAEKAKHAKNGLITGVALFMVPTLMATIFGIDMKAIGTYMLNS